MNALLENLDSQVEDTVEEHRLNQTLVAASRKSGADGGEVDGVAELLQEEAQELDDILAKRGLLGEEDDEYVDVQKNGDEIDTTYQERPVAVEDEGVNDLVDSPNLQIDRPELPKESHDDNLKQPGDDSKGSGDNPAIKEDGTDDEALVLDGNSIKASNEEEQTEVAHAHDKSTGPASTQPTNAAKEPQIHVSPAPPKQKAPSSGSGLLTVTSSAPAVDNKQLKELRKLRRNVVQLNSDLESAEREIEAQRQELDRAASRMERDRSRHKQEKETHAATHKAELAALTAAHDRALQQLKDAGDIAMKEMEDRVARAEQQRALEGGERDAELADALERERGAVASSARLQEEKMTMSERVSSLTSEVSRLETRLEHATSQMELASERERNAEEQLDKSLTIHARQLGVRQKREAELEQTIAELGAALVVSKSKIESAVRAGVDLDGGNQQGRSGFQSGDDGDSIDLTAKLQDAQDEIDTLQVQLSLERQRCSTLHSELQDLSQAQAEEISGAYSKQRQYERKISDLTSLVANLQPRGGSDPGDETGEDFSSSSRRQNSGDEKKEADHLRKQISTLTEKVFEQQTKVDHSRSEVSTLKSRLRSAVLRAETAEKSLETANQRLLMLDTTLNSGVSSCDEEMGGTLHRRRAQRRGFHKTSKVESIRSALGLHEGRIPTGGFQEMATSLLDTFDGVAVDLGSHFRHYPISRLAFLLYLAMLHVYAFFLLVYHAHAQGTGVEHYGPESMLRLHGHVDPAVVSAAAPP